MSDQTASALLRAGRLADAIGAAQMALRKAPMDLGARLLLAELLVLSGNLERADVILDAASTVDPATAMATAEFRQLIRGETARRQLYRDGRVPEFLDGPTEVQRLQLAAMVSLRAGDASEAASLTQMAETSRPPVPGRHNDISFDDFRDADDLLAGSFEVLTTTGKYFWIPTERVVSVECDPPKRPRDLLWRRATMEVANGPDGVVYLPAVYAVDDNTSDALRLGRSTDWRQVQGGPTQGLGQRLYLAGEEGLEIMSVGSLRFAP